MDARPAEWLDRLFSLVGYRADQRAQKRTRARRRLGLDIAATDPRIHESSRGGSDYPQEAEMTEQDAQATEDPTEDAAEMPTPEEAGEAMADAVQATADATGVAGPDETATIIVHYLGFTIDRGKLPTGHFPTKAKLEEKIQPAILNKGWTIGSPNLKADQLPEVGCYREKAKAISAARRAAKAAAPCRLVILDSDGDEVSTETHRQKTGD